MKKWEAPRIVLIGGGRKVLSGDNYAWTETGHIMNADNPWGLDPTCFVPAACQDTQNPLGHNS